MQLLRRPKKPSQAANPPLNGSITLAPYPDSNPTTGAEVEAEKNPVGLVRTRTEDIVYPSGLKLMLLMVSVFVSMFLVALVRRLTSPCSTLIAMGADRPNSTGPAHHLDGDPSDHR